MSSFTTPLLVKVDDSGRIFELLENFSFYRTGKEEETITVPKGFLTDFASIPQFAWSIYPPLGKYGKAAVIHDWLYKQAGLQGHYKRKDCDDIFLDGMTVLGVSFISRHIIYNMVRLFGWKFFGTYDLGK